MDQRRIVDNEITIMELVRQLDRERVRMLLVELCDIYRVKTVRRFLRRTHNRHHNTWTSLRNKRQAGIVKVGVDDHELLLCLADEFLHLYERIEELPVEKDLLLRELLVVHRVEDELEAFFVVGLVCVVFRLVDNLATFCGFNACQERGK